MNKNKKKIPRFKSKEEEAKFWETHSLADYWEEFKKIDLVVELHKPKEKTLVVRLQGNVKEKLDKAAKIKGLSTSSLARIWLMEKLNQML